MYGMLTYEDATIASANSLANVLKNGDALLLRPVVHDVFHLFVAFPVSGAKRKRQKETSFT